MKEYLAVILVGAVAFVGVFLGLWKIDTFGLMAILAGVFVLVSKSIFPYFKIVGFALIGIGLLLWFDVIAVSGAA